MKYEYDMVYLSGLTASPKDTLNRLGADGWKLIGIENGWAYMMRELPETTTGRKVTVKAEGQVKPKSTRKRTTKKAAK